MQTNSLVLILFLIILLCPALQAANSLPVREYDYHIPANILSPIALGMGGINLTNAADYFTSYDNPALLSSNLGSAFATSFRLKKESDMTFAELMRVSNLLREKQFMYFTLITKSAAISFQPVANVHESYGDATFIKYYNYQLDKYQLSFAGKDDDWKKMNAGLNLKYLTGRLVYLDQVYSNPASRIFIDDKVKGVSGDLGFTYTTGTSVWGVCFYDLYSKLLWENYPSRSLKRRAAFGYQFNGDGYSLLASLQGKLSSEPETTYHLGMVRIWNWTIEDAFSKNKTEQNLIFRLGFFSKDFNGVNNINYTLGSGYNLNMFRIDFALTNSGMKLKDSQYLFSVGVGIDR